MRRNLLIIAGLIAGPAFAQSAQGDLAITIYNDDIALVEDVRQLDIPAGRARIEFPDVSARIRPETVSFAAADASIVEQNFDYDLLSPEKLMNKAVGKTVTLVRTNPATGIESRETAKVLSNVSGVVLEIGDRIEVLRDDGLPVRVIFDRVPEHLRARPTLSVTIASARAGRRPARLSYLTPALSWRADYVVLFDETAQTLDIQGWVTLSNRTGTTFENASLMMVAGRRAGQLASSGSGELDAEVRPASGPAPTSPSANERLRFGDFYLYPLPGRTTVADAQTKQIGFLDIRGAAARKAYRARIEDLQGSETSRGVTSLLRFATGGVGGLGAQLPAGIARAYLRDARGTPQFIGENRLDHSPLGAEIALATGEAFDVRVRPIVEQKERIGGNRSRTSMRYVLTNARSEMVTVELLQAGLSRAGHETRLLSASAAGERLSADGSRWLVQVPANGEASVTAVFETHD